MGSIPTEGTKIPHAMWPKTEKTKQKAVKVELFKIYFQFCNFDILLVRVLTLNVLL